LDAFTEGDPQETGDGRRKRQHKVQAADYPEVA